jgi:hypothetical protein
MGCDEVLPHAVMKWTSLTHEAGGTISVKGQRESLALFNDGNTNRNRKVTFKTLANAIEEQL